MHMCIYVAHVESLLTLSFIRGAGLSLYAEVCTRDTSTQHTTFDENRRRPVEKVGAAVSAIARETVRGQGQGQISVSETDRQTE